MEGPSNQMGTLGTCWIQCLTNHRFILGPWSASSLACPLFHSHCVIMGCVSASVSCLMRALSSPAVLGQLVPMSSGELGGSGGSKMAGAWPDVRSLPPLESRIWEFQDGGGWPDTLLRWSHFCHLVLDMRSCANWWVLATSNAGGTEEDINGAIKHPILTGQ